MSARRYTYDTPRGRSVGWGIGLVLSDADGSTGASFSAEEWQTITTKMKRASDEQH